MAYRYCLLENMRRIVQNNSQSFHTPGHKSGQWVPEILKDLWGDAFWAYDLTEIASLDNLHFAFGCIKDSQRQAAEIYGAKETYYLINGTTAGLQGAIMAACYGAQVFVPRHVHRSIYHSLILAQAEPIYLPITIDDASSLPLGVAAAVLEEYIERYPQCRCLILVNPTYQGFTWQNEECLKLAKANGLTVIVDEAHGSHLHFNAALPPSLLDLGADLVVQSWHKTLPVMTQGSVLHVGEGYQGPPLESILSLLQSTSPSYLLMASLEAASVLMANEGREIIAASMVKLTGFFEKLNTLATIYRLAQEYYQQDIFKLYLCSRKLTGEQLEAKLREEFQIYAEMHDSIGVLFMLPLKIEDSLLNRLYDALWTIDKETIDAVDSVARKAFYRAEIPKKVLSLARGFRSEKKTVPLRKAAGCVCGEFLIKYPPGIPMLVPGELIEKSHCTLWCENGGSLDDEIIVIQ